MNLILQNDVLFPLLKDTSTLGKMRDEYATNLFNFQTTFGLYSSSISVTFIYFLIYSLYHEALLNPNFSNQTRIYF